MTTLFDEGTRRTKETRCLSVCDDIKLYLVSSSVTTQYRFDVVIAATTLLEVRAGCVMQEKRVLLV